MHTTGFAGILSVASAVCAVGLSPKAIQEVGANQRRARGHADGAASQRVDGTGLDEPRLSERSARHVGPGGTTRSAGPGRALLEDPKIGELHLGGGRR